ncbi:hypothetical protein [Algivirga pacifica]|uniref:Immunity protein 35 domain-containing protein n=1 Tax=Algivirga pacifica TaxID=1162670 RepID=A0ABP9DNB8_9BACT
MDYTVIELILKEYLNSLSERLKNKIIIDKDYTWETSEYFIIGYNSESFLNNGNISDALVGNYPIVIDKSTKHTYQLINYEDDFEKYTIDELIDKNIIEKFPYD